MTSSDRFAWWNSLKHGGLLIAPARLAEHFPQVPDPLPSRLVERLRRDLTRLDAGSDASARDLLETVLEGVCGLEGSAQARWLKGGEIGSEWSRRSVTGELLKPRWLWQATGGFDFPVFVDDRIDRVGVGRGRRSVSRVVEWLRASDRKLALLTNLRQWRLVYAGLDFEAWAEWDTALWLEEGGVGRQVEALRLLLDREKLTPPGSGEAPPLLAAIEASRKGQAELSAELGERVRTAVERLIQADGPALERLVQEGWVTPRDVYIAATRIIMRMVVVLFAEARDLLPRDNPVFHGAYGLEGLREALDRAGGGTARARLRHRFGAWPRVLALFALVHRGSHHPELPVPRYGGDLFAPGDLNAHEPIRRALAVLEDPEHAPSDAAVHEVLGLLCRSRVRVRQGRGSTWVEAPVDFSDLSSEYIGILYEGLLDFELRQAAAGDPMVFLALGDEPALPLSRLEAMDDRGLKGLLEKLKVRKTAGAGASEGAEDEEAAEEDGAAEEDLLDAEGGLDEAPDQTEESAASVEPAEPSLPETPNGLPAEAGEDARRVARERAIAGARRAVLAGGLVARPRSTRSDAQREHAARVDALAEALVRRVVLPGEWFLVRWGGTRKGAGTFYTRPQLAVPTVQRTLRPLAFDPPTGPDGAPDEDAPPSAWVPKSPETILALKVCDKAMGSGSFLVASLRFLTDALYQSLHHHARLSAQADRTLVTLVEGRPAGGALAEEWLPCRPEDDEFEPRLRARLKRYVVERCLYGVDIDPLAVELARLALWVETMDRELPFEFLDHKLKCGNSLVGCWFDRFRDYPVLAWEREGGDKGHGNGVHFEKEAWTKAIKALRSGRVKQELARVLSSQHDWLASGAQQAPEAVHDEAVAALERLHAMPVHDADGRARYYREQVQQNSAVRALKRAFDAWCAVWFWPATELDTAPMPGNFDRLPPETLERVEGLAREHRFFHWEIEFPDVFTGTASSPAGKAEDRVGGFDAVVGNPPWEIQKPSSKEYFSNVDPLYRTYGKQEALHRQTEIFMGAPAHEEAWLAYNARFKALSNWVKHVGSPFGDGADGGETFSFGRGGAELHRAWAGRRAERKGYSDPRHPFRHQGSADINTYKLFLELSHALLRTGGQLGMIVPSGLYTDKGSTDLRALFLNRCRWRWLFGFENRESIFDIHRSFKFGPVIVKKGGHTEAIQTAFMRHDLADWERAETLRIPYASRQVERFSPRTRAILEIRHPRDLEVLEKIYANSVLLGDEGPDGWGIRYAREFDMTNDSKLFPPRPWWEAKGYRPDEYGRWIGPNGNVALPLYEGRMIGQFDFSQKGWVRGKGRSAEWREIPWDAKSVEPQFLVGLTDRDQFLVEKYLKEVQRGDGGAAAAAESERLSNLDARLAWLESLQRKLVFMDVTAATNARTMVAAVLWDAPAGNSAPVLHARGRVSDLCAILNSYAYDFAVRARCGGLHLNWFVVEESPLPRVRDIPDAFGLQCLRVIGGSEALAPFWLGAFGNAAPRRAWRHLWAVTHHERLRIRCSLDAIVAKLFALEEGDLRWIHRDCDFPSEVLRDKRFSRRLDPKGFWRVDKDKDPELRHTVLTVAAFRDLLSRIGACGGDLGKGIEAFCSQNDGDGWMFPETLRLADLGLGHDERAKHPQPVRERLGPRFHPWQLDQSVEESWAECEMHARKLMGDDAVDRLLEGASLEERRQSLPSAAAGGESCRPNRSLPDVVQGDLFK